MRPTQKEIEVMEEPWRLADERIRGSLYFATSFTTTIRTLILNQELNTEQKLDPFTLNETSRFFLRRLLNAPSILSPFYYLTRTFYQHKLNGKDYVSRDDIISNYKPGELAAVLALIYVFHSLRRLSEEEEWQRFTKALHDVMEIGAIIGKQVPDLGIADSILVTGMRYLSLGVFLRTDIKNFRTYRRDVKIKKALLVASIEKDLWGCTHAEVTVRLLQLLGFGLEFCQKVFKACITPAKKELDSYSNRLRMAIIWSEALYLGTKPAVIKGEEQIISSEAEMDRLFDEALHVQQYGSKHSWLAKRKQDILPSVVPQLYREDELVHEVEADQVETDGTDDHLGEEDRYIINYDEVDQPVREQLAEVKFSDPSPEAKKLLTDK